MSGENWKVVCTLDGRRTVLSVRGPFDNKSDVHAHIERTTPQAVDLRVFGPVGQPNFDDIRSIIETLRSSSVGGSQQLPILKRMLASSLKNGFALFEQVDVRLAEQRLETWASDTRVLLLELTKSMTVPSGWEQFSTPNFPVLAAKLGEAEAWEIYWDSVERRLDWLDLLSASVSTTTGVKAVTGCAAMEKLFLTLEEVKSLLSMTEAQISEEVKVGNLKEFRDGPRLMYRTSQVFALRAGRSATTPQSDASRKRVFVVNGRNADAYNALVLFLQSLRLDPRDFDEIRNELAGSPFIGQVVRAGMDRATAFIVLFTPDEIAFLRPDLSKSHDAERDVQRWQSRPNVLLEAGMALAIAEERTVFVVVGDVKLPSDLDGRHTVRLSNSTESRKRLKDALAGVGCAVEETGRWHDPKVAGDFELCVSSGASTLSVQSPFPKPAVGGIAGRVNGKSSSVENLSETALRILKAACKTDQSVLAIETSGGFDVVIGSDSLATDRSPRAQALFRSAVKELARVGFLEHTSESTLRLTYEGYRFIDSSVS